MPEVRRYPISHKGDLRPTALGSEHHGVYDQGCKRLCTCSHVPGAPTALMCTALHRPIPQLCQHERHNRQEQQQLASQQHQTVKIDSRAEILLPTGWHNCTQCPACLWLLLPEKQSLCTALQGASSRWRVVGRPASCLVKARLLLTQTNALHGHQRIAVLPLQGIMHWRTCGAGC